VKRLKDWFTKLTTTGKVFIIAAASLTTFGAAGAIHQPATTPVVNHTSLTTKTTKTSDVKADATEVKNVSTTEPVAYTSTTVDDATLAQGTTQVRTAGVNGVRTITYAVTYTNSLETARKEVNNLVTTAPVNEVIAKGMKAPEPSCPNGTYVNSVGNTVCHPYQSDTPPAGATAQCRDGSYSNSQSRSGTCSHHGGVARWL